MIPDLLDLSGKRFLITGAASGIGKSTCIMLSKLGAELILADIDQDKLIKCQKQCPNKTMLMCGDLSDSNWLKASLLDTVSSFGPLDGFAHIAGRAYISPLKSISEQTSLDVYKLNAYAAIELSKLFTNRKVYSGNSGSIVFISSVYGLVGSAANVGYAMSKSALIGATRSLAIELAPKKIRVNCVAPGFIKTEMMEANSGSFDDNYNLRLEELHPLGLGEANDIAYAIIYLLSDMAKWVTGTVLSVDGGFTAK